MYESTNSQPRAVFFPKSSSHYQFLPGQIARYHRTAWPPVNEKRVQIDHGPQTSRGTSIIHEMYVFVVLPRRQKHPTRDWCVVGLAATGYAAAGRKRRDNCPWDTAGTICNRVEVTLVTWGLWYCERKWSFFNHIGKKWVGNSCRFW